MGRGAGRGPGHHRQFGDQDVAAVALGLDLERRLDISPAALAFGLRVLAEPGVRAQVAELGRRIGRVPPPGSALDFEKERALRLLSMGQRPVPPGAAPVPSARRGNPGPQVGLAARMPQPCGSGQHGSQSRPWCGPAQPLVRATAPGRRGRRTARMAGSVASALPGR